MTSVLKRFEKAYHLRASQTMTLDEYLELCRTDKLAYATAAERMLAAIGEPKIINTSQDPRLSRLFGNRVMKQYPAFHDFYGNEDAIEGIVNYFRHAAQGLEESKQLLYLLGPVGGGKSSLVERLKELCERQPIYVLAYQHDDKKIGNGGFLMSPYFARPLTLFNVTGMSGEVASEYGIDPRYFQGVVGPWETKRLKADNGDLSRWRVVRIMPSRLEQIAMSVVEPGDENTQDISTLVGKVDIRKLEEFSQTDPDAYLFTGGLNLANQGIMDFREMFKAKIKMLNPLLFAVQERNYQGTETFGALPFDGIVVAHSNEAEWDKFRNNKDNEAFIDRVCLVKVPYSTRVTEEIKIYKKFISSASADLRDAPIAPGTLEMLAQFAVLTRLKAPANSSLFSKMRVYDGQNLKEADPKAKTYTEYREDPENRTEGFFGISTRWASKRISQCFNFDPEETAANPVHLMLILVNEIKKSDLPKETEERYLEYIRDHLKPEYLKTLDKEIRTAYLESYHEYGQNLFDRYVMYADHWVNNNDYYDQQTSEQLDREGLNRELEKTEKAAGIANPKDFRNEIVMYVLKYAKNNGGKNPDWRSYEKLREVIEKRMFAQTGDLLPVISFAPKGTDEERKKHKDFVARMAERGYTEKQTRILVDWFQKVRNAA